MEIAVETAGQQGGGGGGGGGVGGGALKTLLVASLKALQQPTANSQQTTDNKQ